MLAATRASAAPSLIVTSAFPSTPKSATTSKPTAAASTSPIPASSSSSARNPSSRNPKPPNFSYPRWRRAAARLLTALVLRLQSAAQLLRVLLPLVQSPLQFDSGDQ